MAASEGVSLARVLIACETPVGDAALRRAGALAQVLQQAGHEPLLAVPDLPRAESLLADSGVALLPSPTWQTRVEGLPAVHTYTDLLLRQGFADATGLRGLARGWRQLVTLLGVDLLVAHHAPVALFATRGMGLPRLRFGDGFDCPPLATPMPPMTWWDSAPEPFDVIGERSALHVAQQASTDLGLPDPGCVVDVLHAEADALCTPPELDVYPARGAATWCGPLLALPEGGPVPLPEGGGDTVYVALRARHPLLVPLLQLLRANGRRVLLQLGGGSPEVARQLTSEHVVVARTPVAPGQVRQHCRHAVLDGHPTRTPGVALAGLPQLMLPTRLEQMMLARRVQDAGAGLLMDARAASETATVPMTLDTSLHRLLDDATLAQGAKTLARKYAGHDDARTLAAVLGLVQALLAAAAGDDDAPRAKRSRSWPRWRKAKSGG